MDLSPQKESNMPDLIIIAGPNGSGKSTFSSILVESFTRASDTYIWDADLEYFLFRANHSLINGSTSLQYISDEYISNELITKFESIKTNCINNKLNFAIETNLYPDDCHDLINEFKSKGYSIVMFFITLPTPEYCFDRVLMRSKSRRKDIPNHFVPMDTVKIKFNCGLVNFHHLNNKFKVFDKTYILINDNDNPNSIHFPLVLAKYQNGLLYELSRDEKDKHSSLVKDMIAIGFKFDIDSKNIKKGLGFSF